MTMRSRWLLVVILGVIGLAVGLSLALGHSSKYGADHSCPAGASRSACTYPPSLGLQRTEWSAAGLAFDSAESAHRHKWPRPDLVDLPPSQAKSPAIGVAAAAWFSRAGVFRRWCR
jgi:hypothetical protein